MTPGRAAMEIMSAGTDYYVAIREDRSSDVHLGQAFQVVLDARRAGITFAAMRLAAFQISSSQMVSLDRDPFMRKIQAYWEGP